MVRIRNKLLHHGAAAACLMVLAPVAYADSVVGADTQISNAFNVSMGASQRRDSLWMGRENTPSGRLIPYPYELPADLRQTADGWTYFGHVELGALAGRADEPSALFRTYKDLDNGLYVGSFTFEAENAERALFVSGAGGGIGRDDQFYTLKFGRYNDWSVRLFFNETPHAFTSTFNSLWTGVGSGALKLAPPLVPGGTGVNITDNLAVANAIAAAGNSTLSVTREKGGIRYDMTISEAIRGYASYNIESREGARPLGAVWGAGGGTAPIEIPEGIDYNTHDLTAGFRYADGADVVDVTLSASIFRNKNDTLTFEEPYRIPNPAGVVTSPTAGAFTAGRFDLYPGNESYKAKVKYARSLPNLYDGRFAAVVAAETQRQNDPLIPYTTVSGVALANVVANNWNQTSALSRQTADAKIDSRLALAELGLNPSAELNIKATARYLRIDNDTPSFLTCNPNASYIDLDPNTSGNQPGTLNYMGCNGVWGRLLNDASGQAVLMGISNARAGNLPIASVPFGSREINLAVQGDYRIDAGSSFNLTYGHDAIRRDHRERRTVRDDRIKIGYVNRGFALAEATLRASYQYDRRRGGTYLTEAYEEFISAALVPIPTQAGTSVTTWAVHMNNALRKLDLADRDRHTINVRANATPIDKLVVAVAFRDQESNYPNSNFGRADHGIQRSISVDAAYQYSTERQLNAFYSAQRGRIKQNGLSSAGTCNIGQVTALGTINPANASSICASPGGPMFPEINAWTVINRDRSGSYGGGFSEDLGQFGLLGVAYTHTRGRAKLAYTYIPGGAVTVANAPFAGTGMPDIVTRQNIVDASLLVPVTGGVDLRLIYRYEDQRVNDWHYRGLEASPIAGGGTALPTAIILDGGPQDFNANLVGALIRLSF